MYLNWKNKRFCGIIYNLEGLTNENLREDRELGRNITKRPTFHVFFASQMEIFPLLPQVFEEAEESRIYYIEGARNLGKGRINISPDD